MHTNFYRYIYISKYMYDTHTKYIDTQTYLECNFTDIHKATLT